jgi:aspartate kinase
VGIVVKKFGGTSVGSIERIKNVAKLIKEYLDSNPNDKVAVVVSAMAGETNRLISLAKECVPNPDARELDVLLATGEQASIALLSMALLEIGIKAESFTSSQAQIHTDDKFNNAKISGIESVRLKNRIADGVIPVVAGFQGIDDQGNITTLGRGGSDITAVALAVALEAKACFIYTDVEGVFTTDPRICSKAKPLAKISHEEMLEMASLGAKVLHPRSVYFAMRYEMPLVVLSTFNPKNGNQIRGTWIVKEEDLMEKAIVTGITHRVDETKLTVQGLPADSSAINSLFSELSEKGVFIDMITQTGLVDEKTNVSFTVPNEAFNSAKIVSEDIAKKYSAKLLIEEDIAKVSIIGIGMKYHTGVASRMFAALAKENISIQMIGTSEIKLSVVVPRKYCEVAVRALHASFIEDEPSISIEQ